MSQSSQQEVAPIDLEEQSRKSMQAVGALIERIAPWLFSFGSWIFGGLIALHLLIIPALITVGPAHLPILVSIAIFACALPLSVAGLFLSKLVQEMKNADIDEHMLQAFEEAGFPIDVYVPHEKTSLHRRRTTIALCYAIGILVLSVLLTLVGVAAALWYMAWWVALIFLVIVLLSQGLIVVAFAQSLLPESEEEKELKRRYKEYLVRQKQKVTDN